MAESLHGLIERVTFHNPENGFAVLRVQVRGRRDLVTVVGHLPAATAGEHVQADGDWFNDPVHGVQFRSTTLRSTPPMTREGIEKYLGSGVVKGVGPHFASRLVAAFGVDVFDVIEREPARLRDISGIGPLRAARIVGSWNQQKAVRDIMVFLHAHGVGTQRAARIYRTYGPDAVRLIRENPYRLASEIRGIGFVTADQVAERLGIEKTALIRARAGIAYTLSRASDEGHCGLPATTLRETAARLLGIPQPIIDTAIELELAGSAIVSAAVDGTTCLFLASLHAAEAGIAGHVSRLRTGAPPWRPFDLDRAIPWVEARLGMTLAPSQNDALRLAARTKFVVLTGGPGVGKTTLLRAILTVLGVKGVRAVLAAPTGRAAKRLSEVTGLEAKTIHRLLEVDPAHGGFRRNEQRPLDADLLVVDESSMVDVVLMHALLRAVPTRASVIVVGDVDQLPSVGPGQVLSDLIESRAVPVVRLTEVFRQAQESRIVTSAHRINQGLMPSTTRMDDSGDFYFVDADDPVDAARRILQLVKERIPARFGLHPVRDIQVLSPMNRGSVGARALNLELRAALNPAAGATIQRFGWTFAMGDKVMQIENDYDKDVYNGDIGFVTGIDTEEGEVTIEFDGRRVLYDADELDRVVLAYATTIHKAQGSEYPAVVVPVSTQHYPMLQRRLLYTAVTRGRKLVVLVGQPRALAIAVRGTQAIRRWSRLRALLRDQSAG